MNLQTFRLAPLARQLKAALGVLAATTLLVVLAFSQLTLLAVGVLLALVLALPAMAGHALNRGQQRVARRWRPTSALTPCDIVDETAQTRHAWEVPMGHNEGYRLVLTAEGYRLVDAAGRSVHRF